MKLVAIISAAILTLGSNIALAESTTGNASVTIQETLSFVEDQSVDFGAISDSDGTCTMAANGALSGQCVGQPDGTPGQFTVSGSPGQLVNVSVGSGSSIDGVTFNPVLDSTASATLDGSGDTVVDVIGNISLASATGGTKALTYTMTVNYN